MRRQETSLITYNKTRIVIIGAGGHAHVVADILLQLQRNGSALTLVGFLDDRASLSTSSVLGLPVLGRLADLASLEFDAVIVAIGDNRTRCRLFEDLQARKINFESAIHPKAVLGLEARAAAGTVMAAGSVVNSCVTIASNTILNTSCSIDHHCRIGSHVHIAPGVRLGGAVTVEEGALVGIGAVVLPGLHVGAWSVVGAGATVTEDVPEGSIVVGCPARPK